MSERREVEFCSIQDRFEEVIMTVFNVILHEEM